MKHSVRSLDDFGTDIRPAYMAHFVLYSTRFVEMIEWYKKVLNVREVFNNGELCFLTFDDEHHRLVIRRKASLKAPDPQAWGVAHIAYSYPSLGALLGNYVRLRKAGIAPNRAVNHGPTTSFYYFDPDGTNIELQTDNFDGFEKTVAFMNSEAFRRDPRGIPFDPEQLVRDYEAGIPEDVLKKRADVAS